MNAVVLPTYSTAERDRRWQLARTFMDREGLDALIVYGEHEDAGPAAFNLDTWFTNDRPGSVVVLAEAAEPIVHAPMALFIEDHSASRRDGDVVWTSPENIRLSRSVAGIAETLHQHHLGRATIGVVGLEPYPPFLPESIIPHRWWSALTAQFPRANFKPVGLAFARVLMPLSAEEVAVVRHSAGIGDEMVEAMVSTARPGATEAEVYAAGMAAAHRRGTVVPGMHLRSGPEPAEWGPPRWSYRPQAPRVLQDGDVIATEVFCSFGMRATQHQASIAIGEVHRDFERAATVARECYDAGLALLRTGQRFGAVADAMIEPVKAAGGWVRGPQIHGLNPFGSLCAVPPELVGRFDGADRYPAMSGIPTQMADMDLEPGMTFAVEPSCVFGRRPVTLGGTVVVGDDGPIELNPLTAQLLRA